MRLPLTVALSCLAASFSTASAAGPIAFEFELSGGTQLLDTELANYRWDIKQSGLIGFEARAEAGRFGLGLRANHSNTSQGLGIPGDNRRLDVQLNSLELRGRIALLETLGFGLYADAGLGRLRISYGPDRLLIVPLGASEAIDVRFERLEEWLGTAGASIRRDLGSRVALGLQIERTSFGLDTARRVGTDIEEQRDRFGNWSGRLSLTWKLGGR